MDIRAATASFLEDRRLGHGRRRACRTSTINEYAKQLRRFNDFLDLRGVADIERLVVDDFVAFLEAMRLPARRPLSDVTIQKRMLTLRVYASRLSRVKLIAGNFADDLPLPEAGEVLPKSLTPSQSRLLLSASMSIRDRAILAVLFECGLRLAETCALDVDDLDLDDGTLWIRVGKGGKQRVLIFEAETKRLLREWLAVRETGGPALFVSEHANGKGVAGGRLSHQGLYKAVKRIAESVGPAKDVSPHDLRHTCAVTLLDNEVQPDVVQEVLGHKDISTTLRYTYVSKTRLRRSYRTASPMNSLNRKD